LRTARWITVEASLLLSVKPDGWLSLSDHGLFLGFGRGEMLGVLVGLLRLFKGRLLLDFLRAGDQVVDLGHDKSLRNDRSPSRFKVRARAAKRSSIQIKHWESIIRTL